MSLPSLQAEREKWKKGITMYTTTIAPTVATAGILTVTCKQKKEKNANPQKSKESFRHIAFSAIPQSIPTHHPINI